MDSGKLGFLVSVLQRKLDSPFLVSNGIRWPLALIRNVEERGGLLFTDLRKLVCFENTKMAQLVYHFTQKIMGQ